MSEEFIVVWLDRRVSAMSRPSAHTSVANTINEETYEEICQQNWKWTRLWENTSRLTDPSLVSSPALVWISFPILFPGAKENMTPRIAPGMIGNVWSRLLLPESSTYKKKTGKEFIRFAGSQSSSYYSSKCRQIYSFPSVFFLWWRVLFRTLF